MQYFGRSWCSPQSVSHLIVGRGGLINANFCILSIAYLRQIRKTVVRTPHSPPHYHERLVPSCSLLETLAWYSNEVLETPTASEVSSLVRIGKIVNQEVGPHKSRAASMDLGHWHVATNGMRGRIAMSLSDCVTASLGGDTLPCGLIAMFHDSFVEVSVATRYSKLLRHSMTRPV